MKKTLFAFLAVAVLLGTSGNANATITWTGGTTLTGSSDINTTGVLGAAYNGTAAGGPSPTVNGVTFTAGVPGTAVTGATGESITFNTGGTNQGAFGDGGFTGADADLGNLLAGGQFNLTTVTLGGLTIGDTYLVQSFTQDGRASRDNGQSAYSNGTFGPAGSTADTTAVDLTSIAELNTVVGADRIGSSIIGTFTATDVTKTFTVFGDGDGSTNPNGAAGFGSANSPSAINAIQLRNTTVASIPEPSSLALLGLVSMGLVTRRRR